ncbi:dodecin domain-containing protein [Niabella hibiscisoli]|nr:dodecin domain-containing protein [Niabella hibiscisoli]MCH5718764.1 dodecin domain-containing protein [Niabella hibiscisoli]
MDIVKVVEVSASSEKGFDDAIKSCINKIAQTVGNTDAVYVKDFKYI